LSYDTDSLKLRNLREHFDAFPETDEESLLDKLDDALGENLERAKDFELPDELKDVRLTAREGTEIREECATEGYSGDYVSLKLQDCIEEFRRWYIDYEDKYLAFENDEGEKQKVPCTNRFTPEYTERQYARFADLERGLKDEYGHRLHTALLSLTASNTDKHGNLVPPADHLDDLEESWDAMRRALYRALDGYEWEYCAILEPHKSGYTHIHIAVFVNGRIDESDFHPVIDAHVRNCPHAEQAAHDYNSFDESERPISVFHHGRTTNDRSNELENLSAYLSEYLGNYGNSPLEADIRTQMYYCVIWNLRKQRIRPSNGAQDYMLLEDDPTESDDWQLLGIMFESDGDIFELNEDPGTVSTVEIGASAYS